MFVFPIWDAAANVAKSATYHDVDSMANGSNSSGTLTLDIGAADGSRLVVCAVHWVSAFSDQSILSATIGGVPATIHMQGNAATHSVSFVTFKSRTAIISAAVPTGTTANVVVNFSAANVAWAAAAYRLVGLNSQTPHATASVLGLSTTIDVPAAGIVIAGSTHAASLLGAWTGVTETYDTDISGGSGGHTGGLVEGLSLQVGRTVSIAPASGSAAQSLVAASWG